MKKETKGITLIALVVTIVVLLILAGVSISMLTGENGIISQAQKSKERTIIGEEKEYIKLAYQNAEMALKMNGEEITTEGIENELKKYNEKVRVKEIAESEIGDLEIVVNKENATGYVEITYEETTHIYVVAITNKTTTTPSETSNITFTYNPPLEEWTKETVVTASTELTGYTIKMSTDGTDWDETNNLTYTDNGKVYAKLVKDTEELEIEEGEVTNIDKISPEAGKLMILEEGANDWKEVEEDDDLLFDGYYMQSIKLKDGKDNESGHKNTTYNIIGYGEKWVSEYEIEDYEYVLYEETNEEISISECEDLIRNLTGCIEDEEDLGLVSIYIKVEINTEDNMGNTATRTYDIFYYHAE